MPKSTQNASKLKRNPQRPILGAHESIAGGYFRAVETARDYGCDCVQLFTRNNNQWRAKPITPAEAQQFRQALTESGLSHPLAHASYLINLASPDDALWQKSIAAFVVELQRAETLGIPYVVLHPGSYTTGSEAGGLQRIVAALDEIHAQTRGIEAQCLLETTAGQGTSLGCRFEHLAALFEGVAEPGRLGVCFDTCHVFAAGYPLDTLRHYRSTMRAFDGLVGLERIKAFHLNDSRRELGSRIDRHEHIGRGRIGLDAFRHLLCDGRFRRVPMYLETPKGQENGVDWDVLNLRTLRELALE
jgi:deoxyribonuclease IV